MIVGGDNTAGTLVFSNTNAFSNWAIVAAEFAPFVSPPMNLGYKSLLGVGQ